MSVKTDNMKNEVIENSSKKEKTKRVLAWVAIAAIAVFLIAACICMILGNKSLMMASLFCVVIVPIIIYGFIVVYDNLHRNDKQTEETSGQAARAEEGDEENQ